MGNPALNNKRIGMDKFVHYREVVLFRRYECIATITSIKIIKNEVGCRDDTVPKTGDTRRHCKVMQQSSSTPKKRDVRRGLRKIVNSTSQCLLVSLVFGMVSSTSFLYLFN